MGNIGSLLCGNDKTEGIAKAALSQLCQSIDVFSARATKYLIAEISEDALNFGPFCARVLLENACAALIGRLDCFRILYLSEFQAQGEYDLGKRAKSAFSWNGDVIPEENMKQPLWSIDHDLPKISRALFSRHLDHIYWKPAVEKMLDFVAQYKSEAAMADVLQLDAETYINSTKGKSMQLYSALSKGVHWEFFTSALLLDEATVKNHIRETFVIISQLGSASHFIPTAYASLSHREAVEAYMSFRKEFP